MEKLKMQTANKADENFKKPEAMLPNAVIETINENGEVVQASDKNKPKIDLNELPEWQVKQFCRALYVEDTLYRMPSFPPAQNSCPGSFSFSFFGKVASNRSKASGFFSQTKYPSGSL